jgi:putative flippase GtrA
MKALIRYRVFRQAMRFGAVGVLATLVHYGTAMILIQKGSDPMLSNFCAFMAAFAVSFTGHFLWSFRHQGAEMGSALIRFSIVAACAFGFNQLAFAGVLRWTHLGHVLGLAVVLIGVAGTTFIFSKIWAFRGRSKVDPYEQMIGES